MPRKRRTVVDDLRALSGLGALRVAERVADGERAAGITRALLVLRELHRAPQTLPQLAARLGVDRRTVYRDVQAIERAGLAVHRERGRDGRGREVEAVYVIEDATLRRWLGDRGGRR